MSTLGAPAAASGRPLRWRRLGAHLRTPQSVQGYALLASSAVTSVLGLAYWAVAARTFDEGDLGRGAGLVSAMLLVATLATAGLKRGVIRFLPTAGRGAGALVRRVYLAGAGLGVGFAAVMLVGVTGWSDRPAVLGEPWAAAIFLASVAVWCIFVLQDAVLVGARRAGVVPLANTAFSVAKIALLFVGGWVLSDDWTLFASWVVPAGAAAVAVNVWLRRGRRLRVAGVVEERPASVSQLVRFTGAEYVASLMWQSANYLTPLLVLGRLGAEANARFYVALQMGYALFLVSSNLTDALVAHGAARPQALGAALRRTSVQLIAVLVPAVVLTVALAPQLMAIFGAGYGTDAVSVLRLLALASLPNAVSTVAVAANHVRRRLWAVVAIQATMAATTVGLVVAAIGSGGIEGVAMAWLVAQMVTAAVAVGLTLASEHRQGRVQGATPGPVAPLVEAGTAEGHRG